MVRKKVLLDANTSSDECEDDESVALGGEFRMMAAGKKHGANEKKEECGNDEDGDMGFGFFDSFDKMDSQEIMQVRNPKNLLSSKNEF